MNLRTRAALARVLLEPIISSCVINLFRAFQTTACAAARPKKPYEPSPAAKQKIQEVTQAILDAANKKQVAPAPWQLYMKAKAGEKRLEGEKPGRLFAIRRTEFDKLPEKKKQAYIKQAQKEHQRYLEMKEERILRARSPWNFYVSERMPFQPEDMTVNDYVAALAVDFANLNNRQKMPYVKLHLADKQHTDELRAVISADSAGDNPPAKEAAVKVPVREIMRRTAEKGEELTVNEATPHHSELVTTKKKLERKRGLSAFNLFVKERFRRLPGDERCTMTMTRLARDWTALGAEEKARYVELAAIDRAKYSTKG